MFNVYDLILGALYGAVIALIIINWHVWYTNHCWKKRIEAKENKN